MTHIERSIDIATPPSTVWGVLTDFAAYPEWNPYIRHIAGEPQVGKQLQVTLQPTGHTATQLRPHVLAATPQQELRWVGHVLVPGLFDAQHVFRITPLDAHHVRFIQEETFEGLLVRFFARTLKDTEQSFGEMNEALRLRSEAMAAHER
jgi:hypothetical protein